MKNILLFLSAVLVIILINSCNSEDITRDLVEIVDDENNDPGDDTGGDDTGGGDPGGGGSSTVDTAPCDNGVAGTYLCNNFDLINHLA